MENKAKIRINLNLREFEIEGSEEFINSHSAKIESFLEILKSTPPPADLIKPSLQNNVDDVSKNLSQVKKPNETLPDSFGEYYQNLPKSGKDADKILLAGNYVQLSNPENNFGTGDAAKLLLDQGVKLSNPAVAISVNFKAKRIIKLSKGKYKISKDGNDYIKQLISGS
jgi:hypothetical protein